MLTVFVVIAGGLFAIGGTLIGHYFTKLRHPDENETAAAEVSRLKSGKDIRKVAYIFFGMSIAVLVVGVILTSIIPAEGSSPQAKDGENSLITSQSPKSSTIHETPTHSPSPSPSRVSPESDSSVDPKTGRTMYLTELQTSDRYAWRDTPNDSRVLGTPLLHSSAFDVANCSSTHTSYVQWGIPDGFKRLSAMVGFSSGNTAQEVSAEVKVIANREVKFTGNVTTGEKAKALNSEIEGGQLRIEVTFVNVAGDCSTHDQLIVGDAQLSS
jgi:hypothetical protein